jgi:hypothetical protein
MAIVGGLDLHLKGANIRVASLLGLAWEDRMVLGTQIRPSSQQAGPAKLNRADRALLAALSRSLLRTAGTTFR